MSVECSATPLAHKLGVRPGDRVSLVGAPAAWSLTGLPLVDVKVAALGEHWSGLKMVWRKELRARIAEGAGHHGAAP